MDHLFRPFNLPKIFVGDERDVLYLRLFQKDDIARPVIDIEELQPDGPHNHGAEVCE